MTKGTPTKPILEPFSEVIFSTNEMIIAQCYKESRAHSTQNQNIMQGSVVRVNSSYDTSQVAFGIVAKINNSSLDNIHKPSALGLSAVELEHLQPQVYDLLRKELEIHLFAHLDSTGNLVNSTPLKPMMIHDFVYLTTNEEILKLTHDLSNLINLIKVKQLKLDLLVDLIRLGYKLRNYDNNYLVKVGKEITLVFSNEIESLMQVLKRLSEVKEKCKAL